MGVSLTMDRFRVFVHFLSNFRLMTEHHNFPTVRKTFFMMSLRFLAMFKVDQLIDDILFDEHHHTPGCLLLYAIKLIIASTGDHYWGLLSFSFACSD